MSTLIDALPLQTINPSRFHRFTVEEYHRLIESGHFTPEDHFELLEGYLVTKMSKNPPHTSALNKLIKQLMAILPATWDWRVQDPITLASSEPEPDIAIIRPSADSYETHHPNPADIGLLAEVADLSLSTDQIDKLRIYARSEIPVYWIVNLIGRQIEVYEQPSGPTADPEYAISQNYQAGESVPVMLDGQLIGHIAVNAVLPSA
ncbi:Uma2 family endonuclease [Zavarzinella formosa]|uniref:Uma2 family endonuclease n=1 Tax=Zavarzinella formosa TaxID=360055 RepID=UPI0003172A8C|nr:Uma2 family endonuclease [Zavarzinella formosa]